MAVDAYLQIEGIKGESMDDKHRDWIECIDVDFGVDQPRSAVSSTAGGDTAARADFDEISVAKLTDLSPPCCCNIARWVRPFRRLGSNSFARMQTASESGISK